jgi:hypothetical protein
MFWGGRREGFGYGGGCGGFGCNDGFVGTSRGYHFIAGFSEGLDLFLRTKRETPSFVGARKRMILAVAWGYQKEAMVVCTYLGARRGWH